jgi:hypothetical protein
MKLIHRTNKTFDSFSLTHAGSESGSESAIWFGLIRDEEELAFFGKNVAECDVDMTGCETVDYSEFDADPIYEPAIMAESLASSDAPVVRIKNVQMIESGAVTSVYAVRDLSLIGKIEWR